MPSNNRPVIDSNSYGVVLRDGVEIAVAKTDLGVEVGYYRNKQGTLAALKSNSPRVQYDSWLAFRTWSDKALANPVREKDWRHTTKEVAQSAAIPEKPKQTRTEPPPVWLNERMARTHANQIDPHSKDD